MRFATILLALVMLTGCKSGGIKTGFQRKSRSSPHGGSNTARAQQWMHTSIDMELDREKRGQRPPSGRQNWRDYWEWRISLWHKDKQTKEYDQYLNRRRRELGLPSLSRL